MFALSNYSYNKKIGYTDRINQYRRIKELKNKRNQNEKE